MLLTTEASEAVAFPIAPSRPMVAYIPYVNCMVCHARQKKDGAANS